MTVQRNEFTWHGDAIEKKVLDATLVGLTNWAEHVLQQSRQIVPLDEATLERSGVASVDRATMTAAVSYDTPYARRQHEDLTLQHPNGRQAKYLEKPLVESRPLAAAMIAKQVRRATKS